MKTKFNVRVNSSIIFLFSQIGFKSYGIKTISKFFANRLDYYLNCAKNNDISFDDFTLPTFNYYNLNKNYTISLDSVYFGKLKELSFILSISETECFRRIVNLVCFGNVFLFPQPNVYYNNRVKNETYTKFRFSVNKELLSTYKALYNDLMLENNLTAALNDTIKNSLFKIKQKDSSFIENVLSEDMLNFKNDYKYNFTISNKRFDDFSLACESIGISPQECLRKSISFYVKDKTKAIADTKVSIENYN